MIAPTEADIGRRVIYDARPTLPSVSKGTLVGIVSDHCVEVLFDGALVPLNVISNLKWADEHSALVRRASGAAQ